MKLKNLKTSYLGQNVTYYKEIDSTQKEIFRRIEHGNIENGMLVIADIQKSGIGTHGRIWHTDEEGNIAFSLYLSLNLNISKLEGLTIKIAQIIVDIFKDKYSIVLDIKEPNDIICNGKKIGGILTQTRTSSSTVKDLVIGIGINTNKTQFTNDILSIATSIKKEFNIIVDRMDFITEFCNKFELEIERRRNNI